MILITGGSGSGKSAWAEDLACRLCPEEKWYLATMEPHGEEARRRIDRHIRLRKNKRFRTLEAAVRIADTMRGTPRRYPVILLESLSNLVANEMYASLGRGGDRSPEELRDLKRWILRDLKELEDMTRYLLVVTDDVFGDGAVYDGETENYRRLLGEIHNTLAANCDAAAEIVCGFPVFYRGEDPAGGRSAGLAKAGSEKVGACGNTETMLRERGDLRVKLFVGGAWQGAETCAEEMFRDETGRDPVVFRFSDDQEKEPAGSRPEEDMRESLPETDKRKEAAVPENAEILEGVTPWIRSRMQQGKTVREELKRILSAGPAEIILVLQETGCGVVPVDPEERRFREENGRICTELAEAADEVYRVCCGIAVRIK